MYDKESVENLIDNTEHILYVSNFLGDTEYYSIRPDVLVGLLNQVYLKAYSDAFEQSDAQNVPGSDFL
jgi:hypothetical protein